MVFIMRRPYFDDWFFTKSHRKVHRLSEAELMEKLSMKCIINLFTTTTKTQTNFHPRHTHTIIACRPLRLLWPTWLRLRLWPPHRTQTLLQTEIHAAFKQILQRQFPMGSTSHDVSPADKGRFEMSVTNVELVNELPVVQFRAKISGALPIHVKW